MCRRLSAETDDDDSQPAKKTKRKSKQKASTKSSSRRTSKGDQGATAISKNTKKKIKKQKSNKSSDEPIHWICEEDPFILLEPNSGSTAELLRFTIRGNPLPLRRHRTSRGFVYNPSAKAQESFRQKVGELFFLNNVTTTSPVSDMSNTATNKSTALLQPSPPPLFGNDTALFMHVVFRTKRPKKDFIGGRPGAGRLRCGVAPNQLYPPSRIDVDNLAKFVLDSLNGLLYADDRQVVSLHVTKVRDDDGECKGSTEVFMRVIRPDYVDKLLDRIIELF